MLDPLLVALWQATTAERHGLAKSAPGPVGSGRLGSGSGLFSLCPHSCILESRSSLIICDLIIDYRLSTIDDRLSMIDHQRS